MATSIAKKIDRGCRTCIKAALSYQPLHKVINETDISSKTYGELLKELLQVDYISSIEDQLPQKLCTKCASLLKKMYIFILEARKRHEELMQYISGVTIQNCLQEIPIDMPQLNKTEIKTDPEIIETQHYLLELVDVQIKTEPGDAEMQFSVSKNRNEEADTQLKADLNHNSGSKKEQQIVSDCNYRLDSISNDDSDVCSLADVAKEDLKLPQASLAVRCDICDKVYDNAVALKIHKTYTHMPEEQKMPCALCSYKSSRPSAIKVHLKNMHGPETVDKYFRPRRVLKGSLCCTQCPKRYSRKDHLQKHFKKVHLAVENSVKKSNRKPKQRSDQIYLCTFCGQSFAENGTLSKHIRIHTGDKPFKCNFCEKSFRNSGNLKYHLTTHSDEKPHTCSECGKSFKRKDKLRSHMLVHSELRPYKCSECGKTFKYSCVLKTHMQVHNNQIQLSLRNSVNIRCAKNELLQQ